MFVGLPGVTARVLRAGELLPMPESGVENESALKQWAVTSSFGGGRTEEVAPGVLVVIRSATSGRPSSEVVVFSRASGRHQPCLIIPLRPFECRVNVQNGKLGFDYSVERVWTQLATLDLEVLGKS
jgi:hypothetical protein